MILAFALVLGFAPPAGDPEVTGVRAVSRNGQTFVTWKDAAEGEEGSGLRYVLYRSASPITEENAGRAEVCVAGIPNNSARLFGTAFTPKDRLDPKRPMSVLEEGGTPLPLWSGLAVRTILKDGKSYYAVRVTDEKSVPLARIVPGRSAIVEPVEGKVFMPDGVTGYLERMNGVQFASEHAEDLPFFGWCCGRNDGFATWKEQVEMVRALVRNHHGFAFAWNNGDHSSGSKPMTLIHQDYPASKFARSRSYPAFGNSSIDENPGDGDPREGDLEGGINLGFDWRDIVDEEGGWTAAILNSRAKGDMTVDVTPRRCRKFRPKPGESLKWSDSTGGSGSVAAGAAGLVTIEKVRLKPGEPTTLKITR